LCAILAREAAPSGGPNPARALDHGAGRFLFDVIDGSERWGGSGGCCARAESGQNGENPDFRMRGEPSQSLIASFASGITKDIAAVHAALVQPWAVKNAPLAFSISNPLASRI
jgi:hypothetical protein